MRVFQLIFFIFAPRLIVGEFQWRDDGRCGASYQLSNDKPAQCDPDSDNYCCSSFKRCGSGPEFCECTGCLNYKVYKEVDILIQKFGNLYAAKNFEGLSQLYTDDFILMPPEYQILRGKESLKEASNDLWEQGTTKFELKNEEAADFVGCNMTFSVGHVTRYFGNGTVAYNGK